MSIESGFIPYHATSILGNGPVLVLAPHPDDEVFGCAGAIMRHVAAGDPVKVVILTDGGGAVAEGSARAACIAQRQDESRAAAAILGYGQPEFWEYRDRELHCDEALTQRLLAVVAAVGARWLYAPSPAEIHPDHHALSLAALSVGQRLGAAIHLAFYEIGVPLPPNQLLDISDLWERKRQAIACFTSQLADQAYDRHVEALNCYRSYTLAGNVQAAEAYRVMVGSATQWEMWPARPTLTELNPDAAVRQQLEQCQHHIQALQAELEQQQADYDRIAASRSWRLTGPLRAVARWLRAWRTTAA